MVAPSSTPFVTRPRMRSSCTGATIAPMSIDLSSGGPTRSFSIRARSFATSRSATPSCTSSREPAQQTCPWLNQIASTTPSTTLSRSASSNTMNGLLPPSSRESFLPEPAVALRMTRPTSAEPVNAILSTSGWSTSSAPVRPSPAITFSTPGGSPASATSSANASAVSGGNSAGFKTTRVPAAAAAAPASACPACGRRGMGWGVAGLITSNHSPLAGFPQLPPTNSPNSLPCRASQSRACLSLSGAGPYSMLRKISETVVTSRIPQLASRLPSDHRVAVRGRIAAGDEVLELALDVREQGARPEPEPCGAEPLVGQLFLYKDEPFQRPLGAADPARRLEPDGVTRLLEIFANLARHHDTDGQGRVHGFLAGGRLDEVGARHHGGAARARHGREGGGGARAENHLQVRVAAPLAGRLHLAGQRLPIAREGVCPRDHDVDLLRARIHRRPDLLEPLREGIEARGEARRDGGDRDTGAREGRDRRRDVAVIDAHRADRDAELCRAQRLEQVAADRLLRLGAEPQHVAGGVVALERREGDAGDGAEQPGGLPFLLDGAPRGDRGGASLHRRAVHAHRADPVEVERGTRVAPGLGRHAERPL